MRDVAGADAVPGADAAGSFHRRGTHVPRGMLARLGRIFPALAAAPAPMSGGALVLKHRIDDYRYWHSVAGGR